MRIYRELINPHKARVTGEQFEQVLYDAIWCNRETASPWSILYGLQKRYEIIEPLALREPPAKSNPAASNTPLA